MDSDEGGAHRKCMAWLSGSGDAVIRAPAGNSEIVITTTSRLAGAIHSLRWNGKEFIDSFDHGRQLQSAAKRSRGSARRKRRLRGMAGGEKGVRTEWHEVKALVVDLKGLASTRLVVWS